MDTKDFNVKWDVFDPSEVPLIEKVLNSGHYDELVNVLVQVTPEKVAEIDKILRQMRPQVYVFESEAQKEFEKLYGGNPSLLTPEIEREWQEKIDKERQERLAMMGGNVEVKNLDGTNKDQVTVAQDLHKMAGMGEATVKKLNENNVYTLDEFKKLGAEAARKIVGPLVFARLKYLFN